MKSMHICRCVIIYTQLWWKRSTHGGTRCELGKEMGNQAISERRDTFVEIGKTTAGWKKAGETAQTVLPMTKNGNGRYVVPRICRPLLLKWGTLDKKRIGINGSAWIFYNARGRCIQLHRAPAEYSHVSLWQGPFMGLYCGIWMIANKHVFCAFVMEITFDLDGDSITDIRQYSTKINHM